MTDMPMVVHNSVFLSRSIMLVAPRYITGIRFLDFAISRIWVIGDRRFSPAANHVSSSAIQNSGSVCVAITCLSVIIKSFSVSNGILFASR